MDEPCKYYIKEKKQATMGQILSDPAYIKYLEQTNWQRQKVDVSRSWGGQRDGELLFNEYTALVWNEILEIGSGDSCTTLSVY